MLDALAKERGEEAISSPAKFRRVMVTSYGAIGDQLISTPALWGLKRRFEFLTLICPPRMACLFEHSELADKIIPFEPQAERKEELLRLLSDSKDTSYREELIRLERRERDFLLAENGGLEYDWHVHFHGIMVGPIVWRKNMAAFQRASRPSGARLNREEYRDTNYTDQYLKRAQVEDLVPLEERRPRFTLSAEEKRRARYWRKRRGIKPDDIVLMWQFCGSGPNKIYPHFGAVAMELLRRFPRLKIVLSGDRESVSTAARVFQVWRQKEPESVLLPRVFSNCGKYPLRESAALVDACDLFIGPDTGFFHIAQALNKPQVLIIAHTEPRVVTKYYRNVAAVMSSFPCAPCHRIIDAPRCPDFADRPGAAPCLETIRPETVVAEGARLIRANFSSRSNFQEI